MEGESEREREEKVHNMVLALIYLNKKWSKQLTFPKPTRLQLLQNWFRWFGFLQIHGKGRG